MRLALVVLCAFVFWTSFAQPVWGQEVYIRNRPFKGAVKRSGDEVYVEFITLMKALNADLVNRGDRWILTLKRRGKAEGKIDNDNELIQEGIYVKKVRVDILKGEGGKLMVPLKKTAGLLGCRVVSNRQLDTIDVYLPPKNTNYNSYSSRLPMSVAAAYRAIPHRRTEFKPEAAAMGEAEKKFLSKLFELSDKALALRVYTLQKFMAHKGDVSSYDSLISDILMDMKSLPPPTKTLAEVRDLIRGAIADQKSYFDQWQPGQPYRPDHPLVVRSSQKLHRAYDKLMARYPHESRVIHDAFFDCLCGLDFR